LEFWDYWAPPGALLVRKCINESGGTGSDYVDFCSGKVAATVLQFLLAGCLISELGFLDSVCCSFTFTAGGM
jgi:hypothetical protein